MGIDSNIALGVKPVQLPDPMNAMARVLQVQAAQGQNDLARYSLAKAQRQDAETNALAQLLQGGGVDLSTPEGQAKAFQAAPTVAPSMIKNYMEGRKMTSEIGKNDAQAGNFREDAIGKRTKFYRDQLADVNNPQQAAAWMQANYNDPVVGQILKAKQPLEASISEIPSDPAQFNDWRARQALGMADYLKQNKPQTHFADAGGVVNVVQTAGLGGAPQIVGTMPKSVSPDTAARVAEEARGHNMADARAREQLAQGKTPQGYRQTPDGNLQAIHGGPADLKLQGALNQDTQTLNSSMASMDRLAAAANELKNAPGLGGITGLRGAVPNIPGGAAANAQALLNTLKSQVAFGVLQDMRNNSKTGGALGNVSDAEGKRLEANLAALENAQSYDQMVSSLQKIIDYTNGAKDRLREAYNVKHNGKAGPVATAPAGPVDFHSLPTGGGAKVVDFGSLK